MYSPEPFDEAVIAVLTTIAEPTECAVKLHSLCPDTIRNVVVIGDRKGPSSYPLEHCVFSSLENQNDLELQLAQLLPKDHYSRKNLGFLIAIERGATAIYETDDDTMPNDHWKYRSEEQLTYAVEGEKWANVFRHFTDERIWPRGLPLDSLNSTDVRSSEHQFNKE